MTRSHWFAICTRSGRKRNERNDCVPLTRSSARKSAHSRAIRPGTARDRIVRRHPGRKLAPPSRSVKSPLPAARAGERQSNPALALVRRIVHRHDQPLVARALPGEDDETVIGPVAVPGRTRIQAAATGRPARRDDVTRQAAGRRTPSPGCRRARSGREPGGARSASSVPRIGPGGGNAVPARET